MPAASPPFAVAVLDALASHICVLDRAGIIIAVNQAWRRFGIENGADPSFSDLGRSYVRVCEGACGVAAYEADPFGRGVREVLAGRLPMFELEYPCHAPRELRWFLGRVTPLALPEAGAVVSHLNITARKLMELELARLAATDPLTGLPNRRFVLQAGNAEVQRIRQFGGRLAAVMFDLDHFKAVNDTHGHAAGDEALRVVAQLCREAVRRFDVAGRLGGEEFVVLMPGSDTAAATDVAERLRYDIARTPVEQGGVSFALTASFGVAEVEADDRDIEAVLARADEALYAAKAAGRNRVSPFEEKVEELRRVEA
ncbi:MAG: GGDEF domain-containing protein [Pseudomonadota bacterium]